MLQIAVRKRTLPEDRLEGRTFLGPFFIRILITFAIFKACLHSQNVTKRAQKRRIPEDPLAGRIFFGPFFIRILTTFALWALPNALIPTV